MFLMVSFALVKFPLEPFFGLRNSQFCTAPFLSLFAHRSSRLLWPSHLLGLGLVPVLHLEAAEVWGQPGLVPIPSASPLWLFFSFGCFSGAGVHLERFIQALPRQLMGQCYVAFRIYISGEIIKLTSQLTEVDEKHSDLQGATTRWCTSVDAWKWLLLEYKNKRVYG